jgi:hypothetical protein
LFAQRAEFWLALIYQVHNGLSEAEAGWYRKSFLRKIWETNKWLAYRWIHRYQKVRERKTMYLIQMKYVCLISKREKERNGISNSFWDMHATLLLLHSLL